MKFHKNSIKRKITTKFKKIKLCINNSINIYKVHKKCTLPDGGAAGKLE